MIEKTVLQEMYLKEKMSTAEIAQDLKTTFPRVLYWIKKHGIPIRSCSERTYAKLNPKGDPFHPKTHLTSEERELFIVGLSIYWAEGSRKGNHCNVKVVNMDSRMLQLFAKFLREIVRVDESRIRLDVRVYHGFNKNKARQYWCRTLSLRAEQVFVCPHIDQRSNPRQQWSPNGIATLCVSNTKLKAWITQKLEENIEQLLDHHLSGASDQGKDLGVVRDGTCTYA